MIQNKEVRTSLAMSVPTTHPLDIVLKFLRERNVRVSVGYSQIDATTKYYRFNTNSLETFLKPHDAFKLVDDLKSKFGAKIDYIWLHYEEK
jgi:hypothetical protein